MEPSSLHCICWAATASILYLLCPSLVPILLLWTIFSLWRRRRHPAEGRVVFVVGADSGFGFSSAWHLHTAGCRVLAGCLDTDGPGARKLRQTGITTISVDVRDEESVTSTVEEARTFAGDEGLWTVIYNAGVLVLGNLAWLTKEQMEWMWQVNYLGAVRVARAVLPSLAHSSGRLVVVSSPCGTTPGPEISVYGSTKAALNALAASLRMEWRRLGVDVVILTPGDMVVTTNILARQPTDNELMWRAMSAETRRLSGDVFQAFRERLSFATQRDPVVLFTPRLRRGIERAVLDISPLAHYTAVEAGTVLWNLLVWMLPQRVQDHLVLKCVHHWLHCLDWDWLDINNLP